MRNRSTIMVHRTHPRLCFLGSRQQMPVIPIHYLARKLTVMSMDYILDSKSLSGPSPTFPPLNAHYLFSFCFLLVFQSLNKVVIWWAGHSPTFPQESATRLVLDEPLLFRVGLRFFVPGHSAPQSPQSSKEPRKQWTMRTCGTRGQTSN